MSALPKLAPTPADPSGRPPANHQRDVLVVEGMFCSSCAGAVEALLNRQPGVTAASVHFAADAAAIEWRPTQTDLPTLMQAVAALGYRVRRLDEPADAAAVKSLRLGMRLAVAVFAGMWSMLAMAGLYFAEPGPRSAFWLAVCAGTLAAPALLWSGWPFYVAGWRTLKARAPGIDALILVGTLMSVLLSLVSLATGGHHVYFDTALMLVTFQLIARILDHRVRNDASRRVRALLAAAEGQVIRRADDGSIERVAASGLRPGERIITAIGDAVLLDGRVLEGVLVIDRSSFSGESAPITANPGDVLWAGDRVLGGEAEVAVVAAVGKRRIDQLAGQVRRLLVAKPAWQRQVDRLARWLLPIALGLALLAAGWALLDGQSLQDAATRALAVIVIACPCALSLAVPLAATRAVAIAAQRGWLLRDVDLIQAFRRPDLVLLDKTGTLTAGRPEIVGLSTAADVSIDTLRPLLAQATHAATHPLARAIAQWAQADAAGVDAPREERREARLVEQPGDGLLWRGDGREVQLGRSAWLAADGIAVPEDSDHGRSQVDVAVDGRWQARFWAVDGLRAEAQPAITALQALGCKVVIASGDRPSVVAHLAAVLGIDGTGAMTPEHKLAEVERHRAEGLRVAFCGDGANDAPALAAADLGIAVAGATGAAQSAAAINVSNSGVEQLPAVFRLLQTSRQVMRQNLVWAVIWNAAALPLAVSGQVHPAIAAVAMSLSSITVLLNASRIRR